MARRKLIQPGPVLTDKGWIPHMVLHDACETRALKPKAWLFDGPDILGSHIKPPPKERIDIHADLQRYMNHMLDTTGSYPRRVALFPRQMHDRRLRRNMEMHGIEAYEVAEE